MKLKLAFLMLLFLCLRVEAQQFDPLTIPMVYQDAGMNKVTVQKGLIYKTVHPDTILKFDIYYPTDINQKKQLPLVIFNNGVGSMQLPEWRIYQDWGKLVAANGMIAVVHQSRSGKALQDFNDFLGHIRSKSSELKLDPNNMAVWVCSANTTVGWPAANHPENTFIKAVAIYYGVTRPQDRTVRRKDLEILLVRAGLDSHNINAGMEELMANALRTDAHVEFINYPEGQHAFDAVDNTPRSKEIILQTVDFFKRNLLGDNSETTSTLVTNRQLWQLVLNENKTDEAVQLFKVAFDTYRNKPGQFRIFNNLLNENNLNALGYQLLNANRVDDALKIFRANMEAFPASANAYDALSDGYARKEDNANTLFYAKKAIEKLEGATDVSPQFARAIRESAQAKITAIESPEPKDRPYKRAHHELVYNPESKSVLLVSGSTPLQGGQSFRFFNDIWIFKDGRWTKTAEVGAELSGVRLAYDSKRNKLYSFGGFTKNNESIGQLRALENEGWRILSDVPEMKAAESGFVYDSKRDKFIAFGGSASRGQVHGITWEWDGTAWKKFEGEQPEGRQAFAMAYDSKRGKTILFGGTAGGKKCEDGVWEFDGKSWKNYKTPVGPEPRISPGYAFDSKRGMLLIFGGVGASGMLGDTWGWNGKEWKKLADTGPAPRAMGYMAYNPVLDRTILFGGRLGWPNDASDTWEWNGSQWREVVMK